MLNDSTEVERHLNVCDIAKVTTSIERELKVKVFGHFTTRSQLDIRLTIVYLEIKPALTSN